MKTIKLIKVLSIGLILSVLIIESTTAVVVTNVNAKSLGLLEKVKPEATDSVISETLNASLVVLPKPIEGIDLSTLLSHKIKYPGSAIENGIEGTVKVLCTVEANGLVSEVKVLESADQNLAEEVTGKIGNVRFNPALKNGKPVRHSMIIPVSFELIKY